MRRRGFELTWDADDRGRWADVVRTYAETAFPPGGSPCSQASRESLLELAKRIGIAEDHVEVSAGQRPMLKAALKWYFDQFPDDAARDRMMPRVERR